VSKSSGRAYDGCSSWWLRSPSRSDSRDAQLVTYEGHVGYVRGVHYADTGFLPASRFAI
ncbi:MAG: hypothetical protein HUJ60_00990, partial [Bacilli bacterium]|nr:hypothetical protein [Bacilli bacterium]